MSTEKKVAFITGGNRGLGLQTARELGKLGIVVVIGSRDPEKGKTAAATLGSEGIAAESLRCDVTKPEDHRAVRDHFERRYGKLDILINNAAVMMEGGNSSAAARVNRTSTVSSAILHETFEVNFFALVALTKTLLPLVRKAPCWADREPLEYPRIIDARIRSRLVPFYPYKGFLPTTRRKPR